MQRMSFASLARNLQEQALKGFGGKEHKLQTGADGEQYLLQSSLWNLMAILRQVVEGVSPYAVLAHFEVQMRPS